MFLDSIPQAFKEKIIWVIDLIMLALASLGLLSILIEYGFGIESLKEVIHVIDIIIVYSFVLEVIIKFMIVRDLKTFFLRYWINVSLLILLFLQFLIIKDIIYIPYISQFFKGLDILKTTKGYIVLLQVYIVVYFLINSIQSYLAVSKLRLNPSLYVALSFAFFIIIGSLLLYLPGASKNGGMSYVDSLFMSTSAICVTGLSVVDVGKDLTFFGQMVILSLIQIGGIGIMSIAAFFVLLLGLGFGIEEKITMRDVIGDLPINQIGKLVKFIFAFTFGFEAVGVILLFIGFSKYSNLDYNPFYLAVFHSISAFCNAGFSLFSTSLEGFKGDFLLNITFMTLIFWGGIGFTVVLDIWNYIKGYKKNKDKKLKRLKLHSKIAILFSLTLIFLGSLIFLIIEWNRALSGLDVGTKFLAGFFESITTRTAGFDTIPTNTLSNATLLLFMALMIIGASPASTGGGVKTTTVWVAILTVKSVIQNRWEIEIMGRQIPKYVMNRAVALIMIYVFSIFVFSLIILAIEPFSFKQVVFEVISAIGTVGLSTGITPKLSDTSKLILTLAMYIGRIGPLTLLFAMGYKKTSSRIYYPKEDILIG